MPRETFIKTSLSLGVGFSTSMNCNASGGPYFVVRSLSYGALQKPSGEYRTDSLPKPLSTQLSEMWICAKQLSRTTNRDLTAWSDDSSELPTSASYHTF